MSTLLALGPFSFGMDTANYHALQRQMQFKHPSTSRVGARDAYQNVNPGEEVINITGMVAPEVTGQLSSITQLEQMGQDGLAHVLVDGAGYVYGVYYIDSLETDQSFHFDDGTPRRVEFSLSLRRSDDAPADIDGNGNSV